MGRLRDREFTLFLYPVILIVASCTNPDTRFSSLVRSVIPLQSGYPTFSAVSVQGNFSIIPVCHDENEDLLTPTVNGSWLSLSGLPDANSHTIRCETPTEVATVTARLLASTETIVSSSGFTAQGELVSGSYDCYNSSRSVNYSATGQVLAFGSSNFPCFSEFDGLNWHSTRLTNNIRATYNPGNSSDFVTFSDGSIIAFDDDADPNTGKSLKTLRMWACPGDCTNPTNWVSTSVKTMGGQGLAAAQSPDGSRVAVAALTQVYSSYEPIIWQCSAGTQCSDPSQWTAATISTVLNNGATTLEARFDADSNLWLFLPSNYQPVYVCPAASFPCTATTWVGGLLENGSSENYISPQRPAFLSPQSGDVRLVATMSGAGIPNNALYFGSCTGGSCTELTSGVFSQFSGAVRTSAVFPTADAFLHLTLAGIFVHFELTASPHNVRWQGCTGAFGVCSDPSSALWSAAAQLANSSDNPGYAAGQQRSFTSPDGTPAAFLVDQDDDLTTLQILTTAN